MSGRNEQRKPGTARGSPRRSRTGNHARGRQALPPTGYRQLDARDEFFYGVTGITPAMAMRLPGIGSHVPVDDGRCQQAALRRRQDLQGDAAEGHSAGELLVVHALRRDDALDARHAAALSTRGQPELSHRPPRKRTPTARRRFTFGPTQPAKCRNGATGSRPCRARGFSRCCGSTARSSRSSPRTWRPSEVEAVE